MRKGQKRSFIMKQLPVATLPQASVARSNANDKRCLFDRVTPINDVNQLC